MGLITEDCIHRVIEANDIAAVVESYNIPLKRAGSNFQALCPFHNEKTPSFNVNSRLQIFKCFGCGVAGNVVKFVQLIERLEYPEAIEVLAQRSGIQVERDGGGGASRETRDTEKSKSLLWANSLALSYFEQSLWDEREGRRAREYLLGRGFTKETIQSWRLGWAPESWDGLLETLVKQAGEHKRDMAQEVGLLASVLRYNEEKNRYYDAFRGRVMFPIFDAQHRPIGFGGRVFEEKPDSGGKYINSAEGKLFEKRKILYGLNFAAKEIGLSRAAIIVEGYTDTIMCHQYGLRNVVATLGTALTKDHIGRLRRYVQQGGRVLALFDSDSAGEKATERAVELFMEEDVPLEIARGLAVKDACEFLPKYGVEAFREELGKAQDSFSFTLGRTVGKISPSDINGKTAAVEKMMQLVNLSPNRIKREMMRKQVASASGLPEEALPRQQPKAAPGTRPVAPREQEKRGLNSGGVTVPSVLHNRFLARKKKEMRLIQFMLEKPDWSALIADQVPPDEFHDHSCAEIAGIVRDLWNAGKRPDPAEIVNVATEEDSSTVIADLFMDGKGGPPLSDEELKGLLSGSEKERLEEARQGYMDDLREAGRRGDAEAVETLSVKISETVKAIDKLKTGGKPQL